MAYEPRPVKTMDDIDPLVDFIRARVKPLRDAAAYESEEKRAHQALLDMVSVMKGSAAAKVKRGGDPEMTHFYLTQAAQEWRDHPDFRATWLGI